MRLLQDTPDTCLKWSARKWSEYANCGMTTVKKTRAWILIQQQRDENKPRAKDRHQKKKPRRPDDGE